MDVGSLSPSVILTIDALSSCLTGIGRYCWELCNRLPTHEAMGHVGYYRDGIMVRDPEWFLRLRPPFRARLMRHRWMRRLQRGSVARALQGSLCHSPNFFLPPMVESGIITVHDLSVFRYPETHPIERVRQFEREFERSVRRAAHIVTDSDTMRQEIIDYTGVSPARVTTTYMGVSDSYHPYREGEISTVLAAEGLSYGRYALCVSTLEPRKRIHALIRAWRLLPTTLRLECPLVLVGARGWGNEGLMEDIEIARREGWLRLLGYVSEADLPKIYAGARLFLYPSVYEGFGLPPIEAMACGVPTVVADSSCLPEVTQGAAMLVDPDESDAFASKIEEALLDTLWREEAIAKGMGVASSYGWERCVESTISVYQQEWAGRQTVASGRQGRDDKGERLI